MKRVLLISVVFASACANNPFTPAKAVVETFELSIGAYQIYTHTERRRITDAAQHECAPIKDDAAARACFERALAPFEGRQRPVLECVKAASPAVRAAEIAVTTKDKKAISSLLPDLVSQVTKCGLAISEARRDQTPTQGGR